ncbi:Methylated-DNA--protein-cysteine methyltransferase [Sulfidibacter corallicola]|nr:methylated-DNA--[protein]-cysteine S-methyltransferase [Sulfidibacter corallicola]
MHLAARLDTPIGPMVSVIDEDRALVALNFEAPDLPDPLQHQSLRHLKQGVDLEWDKAPPEDVAEQLSAYFKRERTDFDLTLAPKGTPFQQKVWTALQAIPYGEHISYGELARRIGNPKAARGAGSANGANPIAIIIPCHRVIGANGKLTGYAGGVHRKAALLDHEQNALFTW